MHKPKPYRCPVCGAEVPGPPVLKHQLSHAPAEFLKKLLGEADSLIRGRFGEHGLQVSHFVVAVTPEGQVVLLGNVSSDVLRSFGRDIMNMPEFTAPPQPGDTSR